MSGKDPLPLSVSEALERVCQGIAPLPAEAVAIEDAHGRVLAEDLSARMTQPPFDASAMDGYAVRADDVIDIPATLSVIGEAAAGVPFDGKVEPGQAVRIFTGGAVPKGSDTIIIQEDTSRDGDTVTVNEGASKGAYVRPRGFDFAEGDVLFAAGRRLSARDLALVAAMNVAKVPVRKRPRVAILATGDELVMPGEKPGPGQIISSNSYALESMVAVAGGEPMRLGIARDSAASLAAHFAKAKDADVLLTIGGASVGEHDLVQDALREAGMTLDFWRIAMRPGKPLMFGQLGKQRVLGVPGNPVSAIVCTRIFLFPMIGALLGLDAAQSLPRTGILGGPLEANRARQHYMRATIEINEGGQAIVTPVRSQDSSLLSPLASADCLIVRAPHAPAARAGDAVPYVPLDF